MTRVTTGVTTHVRTLYRDAVVPGHPMRRALLVEGPRVAWSGPDAQAPEGVAAVVVDVHGALITPAFVDSHVHCTETGLALLGIDAAAARTVAGLLDAVAAAAAARPGHLVLGHGWDEATLAEGRHPTADELERAAPGARVYLSRVDVHSAVVSPALAAEAGLAVLPGWDPSGRVERDAHHAARAAARRLTPDEREAAQRAALIAAAAAGIGTVHEMGAPHLTTAEDLPALLGTAGDVGVAVVPYWGELVAGRAVDEVKARSGAGPALAGLAGDLCADGSIGSRTAAFRGPYADADTRGRAYVTPEDVSGHVLACGLAGVQAGFHVIGDAGLDTILDGLDRIVRDRGEEGRHAVAAARVRLEHLEAADDEQVARLARHGVAASVQPAFQSTWGGEHGMYAVRLGAGRARRLNRLATLAGAGLPLAFGSDSPVTPFDPWGAVAAAGAHDDPGERLGHEAALAAHLRVPHVVAGAADVTAGTLEPGAPATIAVWDASRDASRPRCLLTTVSGRTVHDTGDLL